TTSNGGRLDVPFTPTFPTVPYIGFEGNHGIFLQTDVVRTTVFTQVANAELNYRLWNSGITGFECLLGLRYAQVRDGLSIYAGDDDIAFHDVNGRPDPKREATYMTDVKNRIIAAQVGAEYQAALPGKYLQWISLGGTAKAAVGGNFLTTH